MKLTIFIGENDSSTVVRVTFDGSTRSAILLSDIQQDGANQLISRYAGKLKADMVQMAHHGLDRLASLYERIQASVIFVSVAEPTSLRSVAKDNTAATVIASGGTAYLAQDHWRIWEVYR